MTWRRDLFSAERHDGRQESKKDPRHEVPALQLLQGFLDKRSRSELTDGGSIPPH